MYRKQRRGSERCRQVILKVDDSNLLSTNATRSALNACCSEQEWRVDMASTCLQQPEAFTSRAEPRSCPCSACAGLGERTYSAFVDRLSPGSSCCGWLARDHSVGLLDHTYIRRQCRALDGVTYRLLPGLEEARSDWNGACIVPSAAAASDASWAAAGELR